MKKSIVFSLCMCACITVVFSQDFIQRQGKKLKYKGDDIHLRGMAFGNLVWDDNFSPTSHHSEKDMKRIHDLGMNAIRFYMNYKTFESDANPYQYQQSGWDWIDQNIQWAKANNIYLILNMHIPQGGFQSMCKGDALWTSASNQQRLVALWKAIASRYKNEPQIAGYDLVNEPTPSGTVQNWSNLAQRIIDSIRTVDQNHLIITERAIALNCDYAYADANNNYPQITENNLMYTVHLYDPYEFTHQNLDWAKTGDGGKYPDETIISPPSDVAYATGNYSNPSIKTGTNDWTYFKGSPFSVSHDSILIGRVVFLAGKLGAGKVYYDDIELQETDDFGNVIRTIYKINPSSGTYWWWSQNGTGSYSESTVGHGDNYSIVIGGNTGSATVICPNLAFKTTKGRNYVISGWMKGENVPAGASASISTEYYHSPSRSALGLRNYAFLKGKIIKYAQYIENLGFPVYFGEFGAARTCFVNDKGGERWVADALHVFDSLGYHFTYHSYKESSFGYYDGWDQPVDTTTVNTKLQKVFQDFFGTAPTGLEDGEINRTSKAIKLYPNPSNDMLHIQAINGEPITKVEILDMVGNVVLSSTQYAIPILNLPRGGYMVKVSHAGGTSNIKFIKG